VKKTVSWLRRLCRWFAVAFFSLFLLLAVGPFLAAFLFKFVMPPTTMFMLDRTLERAWAFEWPPYPYRDAVPMSAISPHLPRAVLASEDAKFYLHHGFDFDQIVDALEDYGDGRPLRGASTISQQTAKNLFLWEGRSFVRKGLEAWITVALETVLSKDRILEIYLNSAEWGDGIFGADAAAQRYFKKPAAQLTRGEAARLAAILPSPQRWKPDGAVARRRAARILARMPGVVMPKAKRAK